MLSIKKIMTQKYIMSFGLTYFELDSHL
jgi:hypothetical protein